MVEVSKCWCSLSSLSTANHRLFYKSGLWDSGLMQPLLRKKGMWYCIAAGEYLDGTSHALPWNSPFPCFPGRLYSCPRSEHCISASPGLIFFCSLFLLYRFFLTQPLHFHDFSCRPYAGRSTLRTSGLALPSSSSVQLDHPPESSTSTTFSSLLLFRLVNLPSDELAKHAKPFPLQPHRTPSHHLALSSSLLNRPALYPLSLPQLRPPSSFKLYHQFLNRFFSLLSNVTLSAQPLLLVQLPSCQTHQEPFIWRSMT